MVERKKIAGGRGELFLLPSSPIPHPSLAQFTFYHGFIFLPVHYLRARNRLILTQFATHSGNSQLPNCHLPQMSHQDPSFSFPFSWTSMWGIFLWWTSLNGTCLNHVTTQSSLPWACVQTLDWVVSSSQLLRIAFADSWTGTARRMPSVRRPFPPWIAPLGVDLMSITGGHTWKLWLMLKWRKSWETRTETQGTIRTNVIVNKFIWLVCGWYVITMWSVWIRIIPLIQMVVACEPRRIFDVMKQDGKSVWARRLKVIQFRSFALIC